MPAPVTPTLDVKSGSKPVFPKLVDMSSAMKNFKVPTMDVNALMAAQQKNIQAMIVVNQTAYEGFQSYIQRQTELMTEGFQVNSELMSAMMSAPTAQEKVMHQAKASNSAIHQCFSNVRDATDTMTKCNQQVMEIVSNRMTEGLAELRALV